MKWVRVIEKDGKPVVELVEGEPEDVYWFPNQGRYDFDDDAFDVLETLPKVSAANVADRAARLAKRHHAVLMSDEDAVNAVIPPDSIPDGGRPVVDQTAVYERGLDKPDVDEADLDEQLVLLGYDASQLDDMTIDEKVAALERQLPPPVQKIERVQPHAEVRGWRLLAWRKKWVKAGVPRFYEVGDTPDEDEAKTTAARWRDAGFETELVTLAVHPRAQKSKRSIWADTPYDPIVCMVPGCAWVGDHLGPHLRQHGFENTDAYREVTGYKGPAVVGKAASALGQAHKTVKNRNDLRAGQVVLEIRGTHTVIPWRITGTNDTTVTLSRLSDEEVSNVSYEALFTHYRPIGLWARRTMRGKGFEVKKARRIQRRRGTT